MLFYCCAGEDLGNGAGSEYQDHRATGKDLEIALGIKSWKSRTYQPPTRPGGEFSDGSRNRRNGSVGKSTCMSIKAWVQSSSTHINAWNGHTPTPI